MRNTNDGGFELLSPDQTGDGSWRWVRCGSKVPLLGCMCERCFARWQARGNREGMARTGKGIVTDRP